MTIVTPLTLSLIKSRTGKRSRALRNRFGRQLPFPQQVELILTYLLCPELVGSAMKVFGELLNRF